MVRFQSILDIGPWDSLVDWTRERVREKTRGRRFGFWPEQPGGWWGADWV